MSYLLSGLNFTGIGEYDSTQEYQKYDIVDYQLNDSRSLFPGYAGLGGGSGLAFWFNNDYIKDFTTDASDNIKQWEFRGAKGSYSDSNEEGGQFKCLKQNDETKRPLIDLNADFTVLQGNDFLSGDLGQYDNRTFFVCFEALPFSENTFEEQNIFSVSDTEDFSLNIGSIKIKGDDQYISPSASAFFVVDGSDYNAKTILYNTPVILSITQAYDSSTQAKSMVIRQNGLQIASISSFNDGWLGRYLKLGDNPNNQGIKFYDFFCYDVVLPEETIESYEKYLFERYFNSEGLFFAKADVPAGVNYGPLTPIGDYQYWTRDIRDLFTLSYGCKAEFSSKMSNAELGDGYESNVVRNINSLNSRFTLMYEGLTDKQAKTLITYFENTPEKQNDNLNEGFSGVDLDLFPPYKKNSELFFLDINHETPYNNINNVSITADSLYDSSLDYKGLMIELDEINVRTYSNNLSNFDYNDVVYYDAADLDSRGYYYYTGAKEEGVLAVENGPQGANSYFTKDFYFKTDIDYDLESKIRLVTVDYEGSTKQYLKDGINYNKLEFDLVFSSRSDKEALAILKFLDSMRGFMIFDYTLPQPYNKKIKVFCPEWSHTYNFKNNNEISAKFIEFLNPPVTLAKFNTKIHFDEAPIKNPKSILNITNHVLYGQLRQDNENIFQETEKVSTILRQVFI